MALSQQSNISPIKGAYSYASTYYYNHSSHPRFLSLACSIGSFCRAKHPSFREPYHLTHITATHTPGPLVNYQHEKDKTETMHDHLRLACLQKTDQSSTGRSIFPLLL